MKVIRHKISEKFGKTGVEFTYNIDNILNPKRGEPGRNKLHGQESFAALLFADDIQELGYDLDTLEEILTIMHEQCQRFGLYVSFKKTFTQEWPAADQELVTEPDTESFRVDGNPIMNVDKFKALGLSLDNTNPDAFVSHRMGVATGQFSKYKQVLTDWRIKKWVRIKFLESYVRSTLLYGINAENPHESQINSLSAFWYNCLRQMTPGGFSNVKNDDGDDTVIFKYSNDQLDLEFKTPPIKDFIHANFVKYIAHIVRRPNDHPTKKALFIVPDRKNAPSVFTKLRFLFPNLTRENILRNFNDRDEFRIMLHAKFPFTKKKVQHCSHQPSAERSTGP